MKYVTIAAAALALSACAANAATFTNQTAFLSELESSTLIDTSTHIGSTTLSIPFIGGSFFGPDALVRSDDLILNGQGFHGSTTPHVGINFSTSVNAVGVKSNAVDGGSILLFSGLNGTGSLLGSTSFGGGADDAFTGFIGSSLALSAIFTCDFDADLRCGLRDPIFGFDSDAAVAPVPLPAGFPLLAAGLIGLGALARRKNSA